MRRETIQMLKERYKPGTQIRLVHMEGERNMPCGLTGKVELVDDIGQIHVFWENGRHLALNVELDSFSVIKSISSEAENDVKETEEEQEGGRMIIE